MDSVKYDGDFAAILFTKNLSTYIVLESTDYSWAFVKDIGSDGSIHVPLDCKHHLLYWPLRQGLFRYWKNSFFHSTYCLFGLSSVWKPMFSSLVNIFS